MQVNQLAASLHGGQLLLGVWFHRYVDSVPALEELTVWRERQTDEWITVFCVGSAVMEVGMVCVGAGGMDT